MHNRGIIFPRGGAGNHLRWMLSLTDHCDYSEIFGIDVANTVRSKLEFIRQEVYNDSRNQKNWLRREYLHREQLDSFMQILHTHDWPVYDYDKLLCLYFVDEKKCLEHYLNVHPTLGGRPVQEYIDDFNSFNRSILGTDWVEFYQGIKDQQWPDYDSAEHFYAQAPAEIIKEAEQVYQLSVNVRPIPKKYCVVHGEFLHNNKLDETMYLKCVDYFGFVPEYASAEIVHQWYWDCRLRKE